MGMVFFGIFSPISFITLLFGRDELHIRINQKKTQWRPRDENLNKISHFKNQF